MGNIYMDDRLASTLCCFNSHHELIKEGIRRSPSEQISSSQVESDVAVKI